MSAKEDADGENGEGIIERFSQRSDQQISAMVSMISRALGLKSVRSWLKN